MVCYSSRRSYCANANWSVAVHGALVNRAETGYGVKDANLLCILYDYKQLSYCKQPCLEDNYSLSRDSAAKIHSAAPSLFNTINHYLHHAVPLFWEPISSLQDYSDQKHMTTKPMK